MENIQYLKLQNYLNYHCNASLSYFNHPRFEFKPRQMLAEIQVLVDDFLGSESDLRWLVIPSLRGVGKTTVVLQLYQWLRQRSQVDKLDVDICYLSLDYVVKTLKCTLADCFEALESHIFHQAFTQRKQPLILLIDEVQEDPAWIATLKDLYDHSHQRIFLICTGSAAVNLQTTADIAGRRAVVKKMHPFSFIEYQAVKWGILPNQELQQQLREVLYYSPDAQTVYQSLHKLQPLINQQLRQYDFKNLVGYLTLYNLPYATDNEQQIYDNLRQMISKTIFYDLPQMSQANFSLETLHGVNNLLLFLSEAGDLISLDKLSRLTGISKKTINALLKSLVKAELLIKVPAFSKKSARSSTNPARYYFMSPALRLAHNRSQVADQLGQVLENIATLYYYKQFHGQPSPLHGQLTYYHSRGGGDCDFILKLPHNRQLALEFSWGSKTFKQIDKTMKQVDCQYGLVFCKSQLSLDQQNQGVKLPLEYFFLT